MAWVKERAHKGRSAAGVGVALRKAYSESGIKLAVRLGPDVVRATGWKAGQEIEVWRGAGDHGGRVRLVPGHNDAYCLSKYFKSKSGDVLVLAVRPWDGLPTHKCRVIGVAWRTPPDNLAAIEFDLPSWPRVAAKSNDQSQAMARLDNEQEPVRVDLADVLRWCNENGIPVTPRGRGYSINGQSPVSADQVAARANAKRARLELPPFAVVLA